ncbi:MAG: hypothetical protein HYY84_11490 [Deltaproteobacteria bacterium]|nr:hypothetical protein [Deltaproteobacteria bacterium]
MEAGVRHPRGAAFALDLWRLFYILFPLFLAGTGGVVTAALCGVWSEVGRGRPYIVREWKADPDVEKFIADDGKATWEAVASVLSDVVGDARGAAWDSAAAQKLRERFVDEAKKEPALERLIDQLAKSYEAIVLFAERSESRVDIAAVKKAVGERIGAAASKIDGAKARVARFARNVALYRTSQFVEYVGFASLAGTLRGMISVEKPGAAPEVPAAASGRDPLKYLSVIDKAMSGKIGVKRELEAAWRLERLVVLVLALLGFVLWVFRDASPAWLFPGRREVGLCVVDAATGNAASSRACVIRGAVALLLLPVHGLMVVVSGIGVADRVSGTRVMKR